MNLLRLADVREPVARILNLCPSKQAVVDYINEAERRLVPKGMYVGTVQSYRFCSNASCIAWPRQFDTILAWAKCSTPGIIRNRFYEFSGSGPGLLRECSCMCTTLVDRDPACAFDEIVGSSATRKIRVHSDFTEAAGLRILLQGYDQNNQWITSLVDGVRIDGEYVTISTTATLTTNFFTSLVRVQKDVTSGPVRLNEWDTVTGAIIKPLAYYERDEVLPWYRRSLLPGSGSCSSSESSSESCSNTTVTVIAKLKHIDVSRDADFLLLGNLGAIKLMVQAILKEERNLLPEAVGYEAKAIKELDDELKSFEGDGAIPTIRYENRDIWGGAVHNVIGGFPYAW